ncbi:MAG: glycosyl hydrolase, partial [Chryseobacterium sp.]
HQKGLKTIVGAWISDDRARNEKEIQALIALAKKGLVDVAAIGNEVLHREEISEQEIITYINQVRAELPISIPVGYVDAYYQYLDRPALVDACDVILTNFYPFWEGADIQHSLSYFSNMMELTKQVSKGKKIIVTETGWPSKGDNVESAEPSKLNAMKYFIATQEWAKTQNIEIFHFSSFDESWKVRQEGEVGAGWGIWDKNEKLKFVNN